MKEKTDIVFVLLVYRNTKDLTEFLKSAKTLSCSWKAVVVNSFFDEMSRADAERVAHENGCAFMNVENKGYGSGNNHGISAALKQFESRYIIVANPDTVIEKFALTRLDPMGRAIIGPKITRRDGRNQNPLHEKRNLIVLIFRWMFAKTGLLFFFLVSIFFNKLEKAIFGKSNHPGPRKVYALHGSFIIFPSTVLQEVGGSIFDERMFLFCEENHIAELARKHRIPMFYDPELCIRHKEDGSIGLENLRSNHFTITRRSLQVFFKNWRIFA